MKLRNNSGKTIVMMAVFIAIIFSVFGFSVYDRNQTNVYPVGDRGVDYGLVWFGMDGRSQKVVAGEHNRFFDPRKPTIIFIHGWMPNQVGEPPTFMVDFPAHEDDSYYTLDLAASWVSAGWNIGIFYWHPFSDEDYVWDAEDKIWTVDGEAGMRFRDIDGKYYMDAGLTVSISELFLSEYLSALKDFTGSEIRLAGHSLGNQLAVKLTSELIEFAEDGKISDRLIPSRIALLDPFWSPFPKPYLDGLETGEVIQQGIEQKLLPKGILVEWYHSSLLTESTMIREDIPNLKAQVLYAELDPRYCGVLDPVCKHDGAWHIYFLSYGSQSPPECIPDQVTGSCNPTGKSGPMASTSNQQIAEMMEQPYYWVQDIGPDGVDGRLTPQSGDDWFHRLPLNVEPE